MICNTDGTYTIEQSDIDNVNKWVYKLLSTRADSTKRTFNLNAFVKYVYDKAVQRTNDHQKALTITRQVPMSISLSTRVDSELRKKLASLEGYSTDAVLDLKDFFSESINNVAELVSGDKSNANLANTLAATVATDLIQPKSNVIAATALNAESEEVSDLPYTPLSTTGNESIPGREWYYGFIKHLSNLVGNLGGLNTNGTTAYFGTQDGIRISMVLGSQIPVNQLYSDVRNNENIEDIKKNQLFTVVTDNNGDFVYFDNNYNITDAENGKLVYFPTRTVPSMKMEGDRKVFNLSEQGDRSVQSINDRVRGLLKDNPYMKEDSARDQVEHEFQGAYTLLSDAADYLKENPSEKVLLNLTGINKGTLRFDKDVVTMLNTVRNLGALNIYIPPVGISADENQEKVLRRRYLSIENVSDKIPFSMSEFSMASAVKVADLLVNDVYTQDGTRLSVADKLKMIGTFVRLGKNGITLVPENGEVKIGNEIVDLTDKAVAKAAIVDYLTRTVKVVDSKGNEVEIKNQYWFDDFTYNKSNGTLDNFTIAPASNGTYVVTSNPVDYKTWIKDNAYTKVILDNNGNITQVNGYFEFAASPKTREKISSRKVKQVSLPVKDTKVSISGMSAPTIEDKEEAIAKIRKRSEGRGNMPLFSMRHDTLAASKAQIKRGKKWFDKREVTFRDADGKTVTKKLSEVIPYNVLFDVTNSNGDIRATWTRNGITLYNGSDYTDLYHEAWHGFTQLFLTADQKTALYNEVKKLNENIKYYDHKIGEWKTMSSTDLDFNNVDHILYAEEHLADKFRTYSINRSAPTSKIKSIFKKIWDALKALFSRSTKQSASNPYDNSLINEAFDKLYTGNLVDYTFDQANIQFGQLNFGITAIDPKTPGIKGLNVEDSKVVADTINSYLSEYIDLAVAGGVYGDANPAYASLILTNPEYKKDALSYVKDMLEAQYNKLSELQDAASSFEKSQIQKSMQTLAFAINEFGDVEDLANNKRGALAFFNKKTGYLDLTSKNMEDDTTDISEEDDEEPTGRQKSKDRTGAYAGNGTELSSLERLDAVLQFVFSNIIQRVDKSKANPDGLMLNTLGRPMTAPKSDILNIVSSITENLSTREEMYQALWVQSNVKGRSGEYTPRALMLKQLLSRVGDPSKAKSGTAQLFWNKLFLALNKQRQSSLQVNINLTNKGYEVIVGETDSSDKAILRQWEEDFKFNNPSEYLITDPKTNERYLDLKALGAKYGKVDNFSDINTVEFFKDFGIRITPTPASLKAIKGANIVGKLLTYRFKDLVKVPGLEVKSISNLIKDFNYKDAQGVERKLAGQAGVFNSLLRIEAIANPKYSDYMRLFGGDARSERSDPSGPGNTIIALNNATSFQSVIARPELSQYNTDKNPAVKTSVFFNKLFDLATGARNKDYSIEYQTMLGTQLLDKTEDVESLITSLVSSESDEQVAYLRDFFSYNLIGAAEAFKHADKNMAYVMQLVGKTRFYIKPSLFAEGAGTTNKGRQEANRIITGYIGAELERIKKVIKSNNGELASGEKASDIILYTTDPVKEGDTIKEVKYVTLADLGTEFTVFDDILSTSLKNDLINNNAIQTVEDFQKLLSNDKALEERIHTELNTYFGKLVREDRDQLESFSFLRAGDNRKSALSTIKNRSFSNTQLDENQVFEAAVLHFTYGSFIHKFEMNTLFYGDPVMFNHDKDEHMKRIPTFFATGRIPVADESNEQWLQNNPGGYYDSEFFKQSGLDKPTSNELVKKQLNTAVLEDAIESISESAYEHMVKAYMKKYPKASEEKARRKYKAYKNMKSADAQGWISFDAYRALEWRLDNWSDVKEDIYQRVLKGEEVDPEMLETFFPVKKMQYAGPIGSSNFAVSSVHKYSLMPLIPTIIKGTELEILHNKMVSQNIAYAVMHSGSKVASIGNDKKLNKFYTEPNGNNTLAFTAPDYKFISNPIYLHYFKEQLVTHDTAKGKVKFPTQKRPLITSGLYTYGVPTDFEVGKTNDERLAAWNALSSEKEKLKASKAYTLGRNYEKALNDVFNDAVAKLKTELGYKKSDPTKINLEKLISFVTEQLSSREAISEYQLDFLQLSPSGKLIFPQDFGADPSQIEKLISSIVNKRITDQMSSGEAFIQVSSIGFRKTNLKTDKNLQFYRPGANGETLPMQVKIPLIGDFKNLLEHLDNDGNKIGSIARLNELIKDEKWLNTADNRKMITMGGDRIPIQGHNSMEVMEVAEFLDPAGGNMMVLPLEIVAKTGGDFDIDKLVCLIPVIKKDSFDAANYQNKLMQSMNDILLREDNFTNLTLPNDTDTYTEKGGIVDTFTSVNRPYKRSTIKTESKKEKMSPTRIMENRYNNIKAFSMSAGKSGVSMGAKTNKIFVIYKQVGLHYEPSYVAVTKKGKRYPIKQRLLLEHNTIPVGNQRVISLGHANDVNGEDISDQISQLMNGYLDVAKEDWVFDINAVKELEPEYLMLLQAGTGPMMAAAMLSQPLVKKYVEAIRKRNNAFALAAGAKESSLSFAKYNALLEVLDGNLPEIFSYADASLNSNNEPITPSGIQILADAQSYLGDQENFQLEDLIKNSKKGPNGEITEYDRKVFAHFIEIMDLTKGDNELKRTIDIDTKKQLTAMDATRKINSLKDLSDRFPKSKIKQILNDTYLSNFKTQDVMLEAISAALPLRGLKTVNDYLYELTKDKNFDDQRARENYEKNFIADLTSYIAANARPRVTSKDKTYKGLEIGEDIAIKNQTLLKFGAIVSEGSLMVDQTQIDLDFANRAYSKQGYGEGLLATFPSTVFTGYSEKTAQNLYRAFVYEREIARAIYPFETIEQEPEFYLYKKMRLSKPGVQNLTLPDLYEEFLRNKGLYNSGLDAGKFETMENLGIYSMYDTMTAILEESSLQGVNLKESYRVLDTLVKTQIGNKSFITLRKKIKDADDQSAFTSELLNLMNPSVRKHPNEGFNMAISSFFAKFPEMAFAQAGNNSSSKLYIGSIIDPKQIAVAEADTLKEFIEKLKDPAQAEVILDDYAAKFDTKAPYAKKVAYFNYNSDKNITDYQTIEEAPIEQVEDIKPTETTPGLIISARGPKELVNYEDGSVFPVAKVYKQSNFIKVTKGAPDLYNLTQDQAKVIMDANPDKVFVFDWFRPDADGKDTTKNKNYTRQAWRSGLTTGQSFGITTRTFQGATPTDEQFDRVKQVIDEQIQQLVEIRNSGKEVVFPSDGIGQNFKEANADQIFVYLSKKLLENFGYRNPVFDKVSFIENETSTTGLDYMQSFYKTVGDAESGEPAQTVTDAEVIEQIKYCKNIG